MAQRSGFSPDQSPQETLLLPFSCRGCDDASRTTEVSWGLQPDSVVHFQVWSFGWISGMLPICWAVDRCSRYAAAKRMRAMLVPGVRLSRCMMSM